MTGAWQSCQGDYKPLDLFVRGNQTVMGIPLDYKYG